MPGKLSLILTLQLQKGLKELSNLDLRENPITEQDDYKKSVFDMFPQLEVLDGLDKEDNEVLSEEDEEDEYGEEEYGDEEGEGDFIEKDKLDPEVRKQLREQYPNGAPDGEEEEEEYDEEGEGEEYDDEEEYGDEEEGGHGNG